MVLLLKASLSRTVLIPLLVITSLTCCISNLLAINWHKKKEDMNKTKFIIVKNAFFNQTNIYKPNAALLITDSAEIAQNELFFLQNQSNGHTCGYHYNIQFWEDAETLIGDIPFNQECEVFMRNNEAIQSSMMAYIHQLENQPTHYIYNLKIPVKIEPKTLTSSLESSNLHFFYLDGLSNHHTTLTFRFSQITPIQEKEDRSKWDKEIDNNRLKAISKIKAIIDSIAHIEKVIEQTAIFFPSQSFGGGKIQHEGEVTLKFKNGIDLTDVKEIISNSNGNVIDTFTPEYYFIQLLHPSGNLETIQKKIKNYQNIEAVYVYPKREQHQ